MAEEERNRLESKSAKVPALPSWPFSLSLLPSPNQPNLIIACGNAGTFVCLFLCGAQPTKKIARTLLSSQKASTITFVDDASWPAIFEGGGAGGRRGVIRKRISGSSGDEDDCDGERGLKQVRCVLFDLACLA
jgi:hypothetical protein